MTSFFEFFLRIVVGLLVNLAPGLHVGLLVTVLALASTVPGARSRAIPWARAQVVCWLEDVVHRHLSFSNVATVVVRLLKMELLVRLETRIAVVSVSWHILGALVIALGLKRWTTDFD